MSLRTLLCLILITCDILYINSAFLVLPLKSKKLNNIHLPFNDSRILKYYPAEFNSYDFINNWYKKAVYTEVSVGTSTKQIPAELNPRAFDLELEHEPKYQVRPYINYFELSKTFKNSTKIEVKYLNGQVNIQGSASDTFHFSMVDDLSKDNYYHKDLSLNYAIRIGYNDRYVTNASQINISSINQTFDFALGILIASEYRTDKTNFLQSLKTADLIDSYDFTIEFYKNPSIDFDSPEDEIGRMIFGKFEQLYNPKKYPSENVKITKLVPEVTMIYYKIYLAEVYMQNSDKATNKDKVFPIQEFQEVEFQFDENLILGTSEYQEAIKKEFFSAFKEDGSSLCSEETPIFTYQSIKKTYKTYVCKKSIEKYKDEFPILKFYQFDFDYTFEFTFDDLFVEYNGKYYFLVVFPLYTDDNWTFGKVFLKKYQIFFNLDSKVAKFYKPGTPEKKEEGKKSEFWTAVKVAIEICVVIAFAAIAYYIGRKINRRRKMKAVELVEEADGDYQTFGQNTVRNLELN